MVIGLPMPFGMTATVDRLRADADAYWTLFRSRRQIRNVYTLLLMMITALALFACCWLALHLSKQVTQPVGGAGGRHGLNRSRRLCASGEGITYR